MVRDWTIDTCVLYKASINDLSAIYLLLGILGRRESIAFDIGKKIEDEYKKCLKNVEREKNPGYKFISKWFVEINSKCAIWFSGNLHNINKQKLIEMGFDRDDIPFVAVCSKTTYKNIVSEDSDYNKAIKEYLYDKLSVNVLSITDGLNLTRV